MASDGSAVACELVAAACAGTVPGAAPAGTAPVPPPLPAVGVAAAATPFLLGYPRGAVSAAAAPGPAPLHPLAASWSWPRASTLAAAGLLQAPQPAAPHPQVAATCGPSATGRCGVRANRQCSRRQSDNTDLHPVGCQCPKEEATIKRQLASEISINGERCSNFAVMALRA